MPSFSKLAAASLALAGVANAACPNACSGHGECGHHDECTCYNNFGGNDCSLRVCPSYTAWVVTPTGDTNGDDDQTDATIHRHDNSAANHATYYNHVQGGTSFFEAWPMNKGAHAMTNNLDEGHYYMECANQGLCDRKTGQCECFTGYTGVGCRRSACPNDCSGNGVCRTVHQIGESLSEYLSVTYANAADAAKRDEVSRANSDGSLDYKFWDADMSQSCVCDAGFSGPDCSTRECPMGDDPLTTGQHNEVQWVDVWANVEFAGEITMTYTDEFGEAWESASFATGYYAGSARAGSYAADAQTALRNLPDDMLKDVKVKVNFCETPTAGQQKVTIAANGATATLSTATADQGALSTATAEVTATRTGSNCLRQSGGSAVYCGDRTGAVDVKSGYTLETAAATDDTLVYDVSKPYCTRYEITFHGRSGNVADIAVDTSGVTVPSGVSELSVTGAAEITVSGSAVTLNLGSDVGANDIFANGDRVKITCAGVSFGLFTITSGGGSAGDGQNIVVQGFTGHPVCAASSDATVQRVISANNLKATNGVGQSASDSPSFATTSTLTQFVQSSSSYILTGTGVIDNAANANTITYTSITGVDDNLHYNEQVMVYCNGDSLGKYKVASTTDTTVVIQESIPDCASTTINVKMVSRVIKTDIDVYKYVNVDGHTFASLSISLYVSATARETCDIEAAMKDTSAATTGTRFTCSNNAGDWSAITTGTQAQNYEGQGTTEASPCSGRGICDSATGLCECFDQYSKHDCSTQNALSA